jgi:uncharacterized protein
MPYSALDHPKALAAIFHPRPDPGPVPGDPYISDHLIEVAAQVQIGARFHLASPQGANLLLFHGNGEIAADYDQLGPLYRNMGLNLLVVDYRGYGRSSGTPSVSAMMSDCHAIFDYTRQWLALKAHTGPLVVMGRSLGSASALEVASTHANLTDALIIESGFAFAGPLLKLLGVDLDQIGFKETQGFANLDKIQTYGGPTLIIHAEYDHIIPFSDGMALFKASGAQDKSLLKIENANHNDIFLRGLDAYLQAVQRLTGRIRRASG